MQTYTEQLFHIMTVIIISNESYHFFKLTSLQGKVLEFNHANSFLHWSMDVLVLSFFFRQLQASPFTGFVRAISPYDNRRNNEF